MAAAAAHSPRPTLRQQPANPLQARLKGSIGRPFYPTTARRQDTPQLAAPARCCEPFKPLKADGLSQTCHRAPRPHRCRPSSRHATPGAALGYSPARNPRGPTSSIDVSDGICQQPFLCSIRRTGRPVRSRFPDPDTSRRQPATVCIHTGLHRRPLLLPPTQRPGSPRHKRRAGLRQHPQDQRPRRRDSHPHLVPLC